jgi:ABC-type lipoprotein release transport system permease subunit
MGKVKLPLFIAWRYLFAKKSHNVINIISLISSTGVALGTMALIAVLSVYNGFEGLIKSLYNSYEPDLLIMASKGKSFVPDSGTFYFIRNSPMVNSFSEVVEENVFLRYRNEEAIATIKGIDSSYVKYTGLNKFLIDGEFRTKFGDIEQVVAGRGIAARLGMNTRFLDPLYLYYPGKNNISLINPAASLNSEKVYPAGIFSIEMGIDDKYIFIPLETARRLLGYTNEVTSIEINLKKGTDCAAFEKEVSKKLGDKFTVKNRYAQRETVYKMMKTEKLTIYLILIFILTIISFNVYGSLSMLIIEKGDDIGTFRAIGADSRMVRRIFLLEGWLISLAGVFTGALLGIVITLLQKYFGFIPMPGNFIVDSYPVILKASDIAYSIAGTALVGYFAALLPLKILKNSENF